MSHKPPPAAEPAPRLESARILDDNFVLGDRVVPRGETVSIPADLAVALVEAGRARYTTRVRALVDNLIVDNHISVRGDLFEVSGAHAERLIAGGRVEPLPLGVDPETVPIAPAPVAASPPVEVDPYGGCPRVQVKAKKLVAFCGRCLLPGEMASVPEHLAVQAVASGAVDIPFGANLTSRGRRYLEALTRGLAALAAGESLEY